MPRGVANFGWWPDYGDHRDHIYGLAEPILTGAQVPPTGGLGIDELPSIWNQLQLGSCTAHGSLRAWIAEAMKEGVSLPAPPAPETAALSRLMQYFDTRALEGTARYDAGGQVRDAIKVLAARGVCAESEWPYDPPDFAVTPPAACYQAAQQYMAIRYARILVGVAGAPMRSALLAKTPIVFGFPVPASFEDGSWDPASGQPLPLPGSNPGWIGGHCCAATSYDFSQSFTSGPAGSFRTPPYFTVDNSWGPEWGMGGRFRMHTEWFNPSRRLASDLWVISAVA